MIFLYLFIEFFKIGLFTFGGGNAMIPLIRDVVIERGWIAEDSFYNFIGICESTPGPIAINMATFVGTTQAGFFGGCVATLGVVLPAFLIILIIAAFLSKLTNNRFYKASLEGVKPVVAALICVSGLLILAKVVIGSDLLKPVFDYKGVIAFALVCATYFVYKAITKKKLNVIILFLASCAYGFLIGFVFE